MKRLLLLISTFVVTASQATIYLDHEEDPIPLVSVTVMLPVGFDSPVAEESGVAYLLGDVLDNGTAKKNRQQFLDVLASYGASYGFSASKEMAMWILTFPIVEGQDYQGLADVLAENWSTPRFTSDNFKLAKLKLESSMQGSLDDDMSIGISASRRWVHKQQFHGTPIFIESVKSFEISTLKKVFEKDFYNVADIWAGVVGPAEGRVIIENILSAVFKKQGKVQLGPYLKEMPLVHPTDFSSVQNDKLALIIDKSERNQTVTSMIAVNPHALKGEDELAFQFGNHTLTMSGLGSVFGDEIRTKRGLAYVAGGVVPFFHRRPVLGYFTNPVREKSDEALGVLSDLTKSSYETGQIFEELPQEVWDRQWQSFKYAHILGQSTASGRLSLRQSVVAGALSPELYKKPVEAWKVSRGKVKGVFSDHWKNSVRVLSVTGEATELSPLLKKHFPDFPQKVIPYEKTIAGEAYQGGSASPSSNMFRQVP